MHYYKNMLLLNDLYFRILPSINILSYILLQLRTRKNISYKKYNFK